MAEQNGKGDKGTAGRKRTGRKSLYDSPMVSMTCRVPEEYKKFMRELGDDNLGAGVRYLVEYYKENNDGE